MAITDDALETYTHLPVSIDPQTKRLDVSSHDQALKAAIANINTIHGLFKTLDNPNTAPPPPVPVHPKRSAQINKLQESAGQSVKKGQYADAVRFLTFAIDMAAARNPWEPVGLVREELAVCYMQRSNAHVLAQNWVEGLNDAEASTECKQGAQQGPNGGRMPGNPRAFTLGGRCLVEMGRWEAAAKWLEKGLELEGKDGDEGREMQRLLVEARAHLSKSAK